MSRSQRDPAVAPHRYHDRSSHESTSATELAGHAETPADHQVVLPVHRDVLDTHGAAAYLSVSRQLLELLRVQGGGPRFSKLGRLVRYRRAALDAWLIDRERSSTSSGALQ